MKSFKLSKLTLFLLFVFILIVSSLGFNITEYFQSNTYEKESPALAEGSNYDPFQNGRGYGNIISDLEDVVIPERRHLRDDKSRHKNHRHGDDEECDEIDDTDDRNNTDSTKYSDRQNKYNNKKDRFNPDPSKYILKSEIVPPVCPKCPESRSCPRQKPCPPCKPCGRCPEPAFTCKKVPNYSVSRVGTNNILPMPQLNSFAAFN